MAAEFDYVAQGTFSLSELRAMLSLAQTNLHATSRMGTSVRVSIYLEPTWPLPLISFPSIIRLEDISITGFLSVKSPPYDTFKAILADGANHVGKKACLEVAVGFEEKNSQQSKKGYDKLAVELRQGCLFVSYEANGSLVMKDKAYARTFMEQLIACMGLPLVVTNAGDDYRFRHTEGGELRLSRCRGGEGISPSGFRCEVRTNDYHAWVDLLNKAVSANSTAKRFMHSWAVYPFVGQTCQPSSEVSLQLYELVAKSRWPAESFFLRCSATILDLEAIEWLRKLCGPKDECFIPAGHVILADEKYINFDVVTSVNGHRLKLSSSAPLDTSAIAQALGVEIREEH